MGMFFRLNLFMGCRKMLRPCLDMPVFVLSSDFLRNQCEFFVWVENFKTQILKH